MVICLGRGADLHIAQLMPLPLTLASIKSSLVFTFLVLAHTGSPGQTAVKWMQDNASDRYVGNEVTVW